jgi:hypothetical protein
MTTVCDELEAEPAATAAVAIRAPVLGFRVVPGYRSL